LSYKFVVYLAKRKNTPKLRMRKFCFFFLVIFFTHQALVAQNYSNKGTDFWITYPVHIDGLTSIMGLYITSDKNATGTITVNGVSVPFTVTANAITEKFIGSTAAADASNSYVYLTQTDGIKTGAAIHVVSDNPVVVYAHIIHSARSGATLVIPSNVWGNQYVVPSYKSTGTNTGAGYGTITVVAAEANTTVQITPTAKTLTNRPAGTAYTITLANPGDVYQVQFTQNADISGTVVASQSSSGCKKIAVFSSTTWSAFGCTGANSGDNLFQQLFPTGAWGKNFVTTPAKTRTSDIIRVYVTDPTTVVTKVENGITTTLAGAVNTGVANSYYYEYSTGNATYLQATNPISVVQYFTTMACQNGALIGDPEMIVLNPIEQTINNITVFSAHQNWINSKFPGQSNITNCYLNIVIRSNSTSSFKINGVVQSGFTTIPGTSYSFLQADVTSITLSNPVQNLTADSSFIAIAYGFGNVESYGYNAGTNVKDFTQIATFKNQYAVIDSPIACINTPFNFSVPISFVPTSLYWDFSKAPNITPNAIITPSSPAVDFDSTSVSTGLNYYSPKTAYSFFAANSAALRDTIKLYTTSATPDGCGSSSQIFSIPVSVYPKPAANFNVSANRCISDSIHFSDASNTYGTSNVITGLWNYGDGTKDSAYNPAKLYALAGIDSVRYRPISSYGCMGDTTIALFISSPPIAKFGYSDSCVGKTITLSDSSTIGTGTIVKWYWDYGDGTKDTLTTNAARTKTYTAVAVYNVSLITESNSGCKSSPFIQTISVRPLPKTNFGLPLAICLPIGAASFTDSSTVDGAGTVIKWKWDFGDSGIDSVKNPKHNYTATGTYTVKLTATSNYGCVKDSSKTVSNIYPQPKASIGVSNYVCLRDTTVYTDSSDGKGSTVTKWKWDFGDGASDTLQNTKHLYATSAVDTVKLFVITDKGCMSDTAVKTTVVNPLPLAGFYTQAINNYCEKRPIQFIDTAVNRSINTATLSRWYWDMGNGTTLSPTGGNNTSFNQYYDTFKVYTVKMMVENSLGCKSDTITKQINIHGLPQVGFVLPEICLTDALANFTDTTTFSDAASSEASYLWNYNAGTPAISPAPTNSLLTTKNGQTKYNIYGHYQVAYKITSNFGCDSTLTQSFTVHGSTPVPDFTILNTAHLCSNDSIRIIDNSTVDFGGETRNEIFWDIVNAPAVDSIDENPYNSKTYAHLYKNFSSPANKSISIKLIAHSGISPVCQKAITKIFSLNQSPKVQFDTIRGICNDTTARQITQASETGNVPGSFTYYGSGVSSTGLYTPGSVAAGTYPIKYVYTTAFTCADSATRNITVWPSPQAKWGVSTAVLCENNSIQFYDSSVANYSNIAQRFWDFKDGTSIVYSNTVSFKKTYASGNTYAASLRVQTDSGCRSTYNIQNLKVNYLPIVNFQLPTICLPDGKGIFTSLSTIKDSSEALFSYLWNFGDPNDATSSTLKSATHQYTALGPVNVQLKVTTKDACIDSLTQQLNSIYPQPKAAFNAVPQAVCINDSIHFYDNSNGISSVPVIWKWYLANGDSSFKANPVKQFRDSGTFNISLFIYNQQGCVSDTAVQSITVNPYPKLTMGPDLVVLQGGVITIRPTFVYGDSLQFKWTPSSYLSSDTAAHPSASPPDDIRYYLQLTALGGCSVTDSIFITVLKSPVIPNTFSPNGDGINDTWKIKYLDSYPGATVDVYNRYGQPVFHSNGYNKEWDGTMNGKALPIGTYYYVINPRNNKPIFSGSITIIR